MSFTNRVRVVVTGLGLVTPLGVTAPRVWSELLNGKCGIVRLPSNFTQRPDLMEKLPSKIAALIPRGEDPFDYNENQFAPSYRRQVPSAALYALTAAQEALKDSKIDTTKLSEEERENIGVAVGVGMIDLEDVYQTGDGFYSKGYSKVNPYFVPRILPNMTSGQIAITHGLRGPNHCVSTACATGAHAIGDAFSFISRRQASIMICGGSEASVSPLAIAGFCRLRALSTRFNDSPSEASRPFDARRDGFVIGEGAGVVILEEYEHAVRRKANIYAEILGYGASGDGYHITSPDKEGRGAYLCMRRALDEANVTKNEVGYVNAHATSTPQGDEIEANAIRRIFDQENVKNFAVSSTKGATGHLLGAAGAVEFIFTVLAVKNATVPPTLNFQKSDNDLNLNYVPGKSQPWPTSESGKKRRRVALTNSFGFGGTNACLCVAEFQG